MTALNSFSVVQEYNAPITALMDIVSSERVLSEKGIFIIPYDTSRIVGYVRAEIDVVTTENESRTLWSNPELSFYGYCHIRSYKQSVGNPVQVNQRNQILFQWCPNDFLIQLVQMQIGLNLFDVLQAVFNNPSVIPLPSPLITDLSFGFQREGKFKVTVKIGYYKDGVFPTDSLFVPYQEVPNPSDIEGVDPSGFKDLGNPETPVSPPYTEGNNDYGESNVGEPLPEEPPVNVPFRIRFNYSGPGIDSAPKLTVEYSGPTPTSISTTPVKREGGYYATIQTANGTFYLPYVGAFATQEQEDAFVSTFEFLEFVYN